MTRFANTPVAIAIICAIAINHLGCQTAPPPKADGQNHTATQPGKMALSAAESPPNEAPATLPIATPPTDEKSAAQPPIATPPTDDKKVPLTSPIANQPTGKESAAQSPIHKIKTSAQAPSKKDSRPQPSTELSGCFAAAPNAEAGRKYSQPKMPAVNMVTVERLAEQIDVRHNLTHKCCLRATVDTQRQGQAIHITETLSGTPCWCKCTSVLRTKIPVPPGEYTITVNVSEAGKSQLVHTQTITMPEPP